MELDYPRIEPLLEPPLETFADFEALVRASFPSIKSLYYYRGKMKTIQQYTSVLKYEEAFPERLLHIEDMSDPEALDGFLSGLKHEILHEVIKDDPQTLDGACASDIRHDMLLMRTRETRLIALSIDEEITTVESSLPHRHASALETQHLKIPLLSLLRQRKSVKSVLVTLT